MKASYWIKSKRLISRVRPLNFISFKTGISPVILRAVTLAGRTFARAENWNVCSWTHGLYIESTNNKSMYTTFGGHQHVLCEVCVRHIKGESENDLQSTIRWPLNVILWAGAPLQTFMTRFATGKIYATSMRTWAAQMFRDRFSLLFFVGYSDNDQAV